MNFNSTWFLKIIFTEVPNTIKIGKEGFLLSKRDGILSFTKRIKLNTTQSNGHYPNAFAIGVYKREEIEISC